MRPLLLTLLAVAALAAAPSSALAKGATAAQACGADGCTDVPRDTLGGTLAEGDPTDPPPAAAPFVEMRVTVMTGPHGERDRFAFDYLPSLGVTRPHDGDAGWIKLYPDSRTALTRAVGATQLRPASELAQIAGLPSPDEGGDLQWWAIAGAALALLALSARYATSASRARPRASKPAS